VLKRFVIVILSEEAINFDALFDPALRFSDSMPTSVRDSVFISYSHRDAMWLESMLTFLKPFTRKGTLSIWNDTYIEIGGLWRREIDSGLQRAAIGLLLISPHFLASDFIMDVELPALVDAAERNLLKLVWVPISASHWRYSQLVDYQAAWDPGQPLDALEEHRRNAALVQITERVVEAAKAYATPPSTVDATPLQEARAVPAIGSPPKKRGPGDLHDVPALPPHFVHRTGELDQLRQSLLGSGAGAVGITGELSRVGLHGLGGIGKTVLAAALARDEQVRQVFPDGVYWVTVGQSPDMPRLQSALLAETGAEYTSVKDTSHGRKLLAERLSGTAVLLVLDDVWDYRDALAFDVLGPTSRLLITTRDGAALTALGAHQQTVERLPESAALALLADWAGSSRGSSSELTRRVARECGYLPLALSLAGALVRDGTPWDVVLKALEQGRLEFLDHPYDSVFRSMRLGVDALPAEERERYLELAVFPEDENVPEAIVLTLWKQTAGLDDLSGEELLTRLQRKALLEIVDTDGQREVALHDLQHDFLRISVRDLTALHGELLAGLASGLPAGDRGTEWWQLHPGERYAWTHLASHLVAAGRADELRSMLFDCRWLEAKLRAVGLQAVLSDFGALPRDWELSMMAGALRLSGHVLVSDPGQLRSQLTGRLLGMDREEVRTMLREAATGESGPWLRPVVLGLTPPTGALLRTLAGHADWVKAVAVTPDGRRAVSASTDKTLKVWDLETGLEERTLAGHAGGAQAVAVTPDGQRAVSASIDGTLKLWDLETGAEENTFAGHAGGIRAVAVTPDGRRAVSASGDGTLKVWDLKRGCVLGTFTAESSVDCCAVVSDGVQVVAGDRTGKIYVLVIEGDH
jgi:NB-ARC domain-containing protein/WD40 domain-containing protein/TIR domain-containing protein/apoptotic protease-activating factor 1-like protein